MQREQESDFEITLNFLLNYANNQKFDNKDFDYQNTINLIEFINFKEVSAIVDRSLQM